MPDKSAVLKLNRTIYPTRAVKETVEAFQELLEAEISREGRYHRVVVHPRDDDFSTERLLKEMANFALERAARTR